MARILVVDDQKEIVDLLYKFLSREGFEVLMALDGDSALKLAKACVPDLIILDMNMPNMGGIEFYQRICDGEEPRYPVFVLTARANMEQLFKEFKVEGFMTKPFEIEDFVREVEVIVKKRKGVADGLGKDGKSLLLKNVYLVEDDPVEAGLISLALLDAGYRVAWVKSGAAALELMAIDPPVLGLVKLGLPDIAGDVVIQRALKMAKTSTVKLLLYQKSNLLQLASIQQQIRSKIGKINLAEYSEPKDLVAVAESLL